MTTLVELATKDAIVLGCDSLGTTPKLFVDPADLLDFFDKENNYQLKTDGDGKPLLKNFKDIWRLRQEVPYDHMPYVDKLFDLSPLPMGAMLTGSISIGDRTVKSVVCEFVDKLKKTKRFTVRKVADNLLDFIKKHCEDIEIKIDKLRLTIVLGGYNKKGHDPHLKKIKFPNCEVEDVAFPMGSKFGIDFEGQTKELERIAYGTDLGNAQKIYIRHIKLLRVYRDKLQEELNQQNRGITLPELDLEHLDEWGGNIFSDGWWLDRFDADWQNYSEQNAIKCVNFFLEIMINAQQFSSSMPTVGGEIHIAIITEKDGFRYVSREEYIHEGHAIPKQKEQSKRRSENDVI